jgi:hypothetical protein
MQKALELDTTEGHNEDEENTNGEQGIRETVCVWLESLKPRWRVEISNRRLFEAAMNKDDKTQYSDLLLWRRIKSTLGESRRVSGPVGNCGSVTR